MEHWYLCYITCLRPFIYIQNVNTSLRFPVLHFPSATSNVDYLFTRVLGVDCTTQSAGNKADLSRGSADCGAEVLSADLTPLASYYTNQLFRHDRARTVTAAAWAGGRTQLTLGPNHCCLRLTVGQDVSVRWLIRLLKDTKNLWRESIRVQKSRDKSARDWWHLNGDVKRVNT